MIDEHITERQKLWIHFNVFFENIFMAGYFAGYTKKECLLLRKSRKIKKYTRENYLEIKKKQRYWNQDVYNRMVEIYEKGKQK
jgi:hypothetical protein